MAAEGTRRSAEVELITSSPRAKLSWRSSDRRFLVPMMQHVPLALVVIGDRCLRRSLRVIDGTFGVSFFD